MSILYSDFMQSAEVLSNGAKEVDFRNAASRAYYAAYHACLPIGESLPDFADVDGGSHIRLIIKLENCPVKQNSRDKDLSIRSLGYQLRMFKKIREAADYELTEDFRSEQSETAIEHAKKLLMKANSVAP